MPTIIDVARDAGVAPSTVSYVISGKRRISESTRRRVEASMRRLGYTPRGAAQPRRPGERSHALALFFPAREGAERAAGMAFVAGLAAQARGYGYDLLVFTGDDESQLTRVIERRVADAVVFMDVETTEPRIERFAEADFPGVVIGLPNRPVDLHCVDFNFSLAARCAVEHLAARGCTAVGLVGMHRAVYRRGSSYARRILDGFLRSTEALGVRAAWTPASLDRDDPDAGVAELLRSMPDMTGLVVHNEAALPVVLRELERREMTPAADVTVVTLGVEQPAWRHLPISAIRIPVAEMSRIAVRMAMDQIEGHREPEVRLLSPHLDVHGADAGSAPR